MKKLLKIFTYFIVIVITLVIVLALTAKLAENKITSQRIIVKVNNDVVGEYELKDNGMTDLKLLFPQNLLMESDGNLKVSFALPKAASPEEHELSNDQRLLAILLKGYGVYLGVNE